MCERYIFFDDIKFLFELTLLSYVSVLNFKSPSRQVEVEVSSIMNISLGFLYPADLFTLSKLKLIGIFEFRCG